MTRRCSLLARVLLASLALTAAPAGAHDASQHGFAMVDFKRPAPAPVFTLTGLDGSDVALAAHRGRHVLVNFWATWCPPCLEEMPSIEAMQREFSDDELTVIAVSSDAGGAETVHPFVERLGVTFTIALDTDGAVSAAYGARELPVSFVLDADGRVVAAARGERDWSSPEALSYLRELVGR